MLGPDSTSRFSFLPGARILTWVPPTSTASTAWLRRLVFGIECHQQLFLKSARRVGQRSRDRRDRPVLHREDVGVEIGHPLLAFLRDPQIAQGVADPGPHGSPEELRI